MKAADVNSSCPQVWQEYSNFKAQELFIDLQPQNHTKKQYLQDICIHALPMVKTYSPSIKVLQSLSLVHMHIILHGVFMDSCMITRFITTE